MPTLDSKKRSHPVDIMLDIEALGCCPTGVITQIGWAVFRPFVEEDCVAAGNIFIDIASSLEHGLLIDASPLKFWLAQSDEARKPFSFPGMPLPDAMQTLNDVFTLHTPLLTWAYPTIYDIAMLSHSYTASGIEPVWDKRSFHDARTLATAARYRWSKGPKPLIKHNAEEDAVAQAKRVQACFSKLRRPQ